MDAWNVLDSGAAGAGHERMEPGGPRASPRGARRPAREGRAGGRAAWVAGACPAGSGGTVVTDPHDPSGVDATFRGLVADLPDEEALYGSGALDDTILSVLQTRAHPLPEWLLPRWAVVPA